jgi:hypothetical protein
MIALLLACTSLPETVTLTGTLLDAPSAEASTVGSATISILDLDLLTVASASTDADGAFSVMVPASATFFLHAEAEGHTTTSHTGFSGFTDIAANDGDLWVRPTDELDTIRAEFAGCEGADGEGAIVEGVVRLWIPGDNPLDSLPLVTTATVTVVEANGVTHMACYLDADGVFDGTATATGDTGRFALFGLSSGGITVEVSYTAEGTVQDQSLYWAHLPEGGTFPLQPALVELAQ